MSEFIEVEGERRGSVMIAFEGRLYQKERERGPVTILRCKEHKRCRARGKLVDGRITFTWPDHDCDIDQNAIDVLIMKANMKNLAENSAEPIAAIYDQFIGDNFDRLPLENIRSTLQSRKKRFLPAGVSDPEEIVNYFETHKDDPGNAFTPHYLKTVSFQLKEGNHQCLTQITCINVFNLR